MLALLANDETWVDLLILCVAVVLVYAVRRPDRL